MLVKSWEKVEIKFQGPRVRPLKFSKVVEAKLATMADPLDSAALTTTPKQVYEDSLEAGVCL